MGDMLVKLYALPDAAPALARVRAAGYDIQRALPPERRAVVRWVGSHFGERWAGEAETAFARVPVACHLAVDRAGEICGFACHDVTFRGFFGPAGVRENLRGQGLGTALLLRALHSLAGAGYAYAVIGGSGDDNFYAKAVGAAPIPDSAPGPYGRWTVCRSGL
jgi:GNAT superfamily N-acetyltransferase